VYQEKQQNGGDGQGDFKYKTFHEPANPGTRSYIDDKKYTKCRKIVG
jgi:hypothetical protein